MSCAACPGSCTHFPWVLGRPAHLLGPRTLGLCARHPASAVLPPPPRRPRGTYCPCSPRGERPSTSLEHLWQRRKRPLLCMVAAAFSSRCRPASSAFCRLAPRLYQRASRPSKMTHGWLVDHQRAIQESDATTQAALLERCSIHRSPDRRGLHRRRLWLSRQGTLPHRQPSSLHLRPLHQPQKSTMAPQRGSHLALLWGTRNLRRSARRCAPRRRTRRCVQKRQMKRHRLLLSAAHMQLRSCMRALSGYAQTCIRRVPPSAGTSARPARHQRCDSN